MYFGLDYTFLEVNTMAFSSHALTEVFGSATVSNGDLTIPSGSINSFVPSAANTGVYEMIFGLVDTLAGAVGTGDLSNIRVTETSTLVNETLLKIKGVVHITGDAYLKFGNLSRFSPGIGFKFTNFNPHPIFSLIQATAKDLGYTLTDEEMFKTFNMGWGFAIILDKKDKQEAISILKNNNSEPSEIGEITDTNKIEIIYKNKKLVLG